MATAVVLGGGVSGLAAAYYLPRLAPQRFAKVIVLEKSKRTGGWVQTTSYPDGTIFEHGPRSLRPVGVQGRNSLTLAEDLGLSSDILPVLRSSSAAKNRFLFVNKSLHILPNNIKTLFSTQPPFTRPMILSLLSEPFQKKSQLQDETIGDFFTRRLGKEMADVAVSALCRGVFAGDSRKLSIRSCFPDLFHWEQDHGSIILGGFRAGRGQQVVESTLVKRAREERWASWSLREGLQQLTDKMQEAIKEGGFGEVRVASPCLGLEPAPNGKVKVKTKDEEILADHIFSAIYAKDLAELLPNSMDKLGRSLRSIPAVDVFVVNLEYAGDILPVQGFGHLLPTSESGPKLGVVYDSCPFPEHNRQNQQPSTRLTAMLGGAWFAELQKEMGEVSEARVKDYATAMVKEQLSIQAEPIRVKVSFQKDCIPQYQLGHHQILAEMDAFISQSSLPLSLLGSSFRGASINDCILNSRRAVENLKR